MKLAQDFFSADEPARFHIAIRPLGDDVDDRPGAAQPCVGGFVAGGVAGDAAGFAEGFAAGLGAVFAAVAAAAARAALPSGEL